MPRRAIVTAVYGDHVDLLPRTLASFAKCSGYELHAFVFGDRRARQPDPRIAYHSVAFAGDFRRQYREVNYRRWEMIEEFDYAVLVDGGDTYCARPLPPAEDLLGGMKAGAVVEHRGGCNLGTSYTSNYFNAGVTFWDVAASRALRRQIVARGRAHFRNGWDDQLTLNECLHNDILNVRILPSLFNFRAHLYRPQHDWSVCSNLTGVYIVHTKDIDRIDDFLPGGDEVYPLADLSRGNGLAARALRWLRVAR